MKIDYCYSADGLEAAQVQGFFVGWPKAPSPETFIQLLRGSSKVVLAMDAGHLVGFITALTDGVLTAFIPLVEVLPSHQRRGIGRELVGRMLEELNGCYATDLVCDEELMAFYERFEMKPGRAMLRRNYAHQSGKPV